MNYKKLSKEDLNILEIKQRMIFLKYRKKLLEKKYRILSEQKIKFKKKSQLVIVKTKKLLSNFERIINYFKMILTENIKLKKSNCKYYFNGNFVSKVEDITDSINKCSLEFLSKKKFEISAQKIFTSNLILTRKKIKDKMKSFLKLEKNNLQTISNKKRTLIMRINYIILQFFNVKKIIPNESDEFFKLSKERYFLLKRKMLKKNRNVKNVRKIRELYREKAELHKFKINLRKLKLRQKEMIRAQILFLITEKKNRIYRDLIYFLNELIFCKSIDFLENYFVKNIQKLDQLNIFFKKEFKRSKNIQVNLHQFKELITRMLFHFIHLYRKIKNKEIVKDKIIYIESSELKLNNSKFKILLDSFDRINISILKK